MPPTLIPPSDAAHAAVSMFLIVASVAFLLIGVQVRRHSRQLEALRRAQDANSRVVYTQLSGKEARLQTLVVAVADLGKRLDDEKIYTRTILSDVNDLAKELAVVRGAGDMLAEQFAGFAAERDLEAEAIRKAVGGAYETARYAQARVDAITEDREAMAKQFAQFASAAAHTSHTAQAALALAMESQERCEALEDGCEVLGQALREATAGVVAATPARTIPNGVFRAIGSVERTNEEEA